MSNKPSPGACFRQALQAQQPLQIVGTINAYCALLAEHAGFSAIYLSGGGVAAASYGVPDLGLTSLDNVLEDVRRITSVTTLPLLVDIDTGWGDELNIARTVKQMIKAGAAAVHLEDQETAKRCGHRPNKRLVDTAEMVDRIRAAVAAKTDPDFFIIARTDALANEGLTAAIDRAKAYVEAGADAIFAEAVTELEQYQQFSQALSAPILANITEFGKTPLFTVDQLAPANVAMVLYPLSAMRAMNAAAMQVYQTIHAQGSQENCLPQMETRDTLYQYLNYLHYEQQRDQSL